jgi:SAM-dependent methyltransferase
MDFFRAYLENGTPFAAMLRGAEGALMARAGPFAPPVLDLGCGDGFFASLLADHPFCAGLDPDLSGLRRARRSGAHAALVAGSACRMPFRADSFRTVISNSALEHIPDLEAALGEIRRVLRPQGRVLITVPSDRFAGLLAGARLGRWYGRWFNGHSRHFHTDDAAAWRRRLAGWGFEVQTCHYYFSPAAMRAFDLAHYLSVPRLLSRKLTGQWVVFPRATLNRFYEGWWRRHAEPGPAEDGAYLFIAARKGGLGG